MVDSSTLGALASSMMVQAMPDRQFATLGIIFIQIGLVIHIATLLCLGRSFGIFPANRGIATRGIYRFVRHPLYSSVVITTLGYLLSNFSLFNWAIFVTTVVLHVLRIREEELVLARDPDYSNYSSKVVWRLCPRIW